MITHQATRTSRGVHDAWLLAPAALHDSRAMPVLFDQARDRVGIDGGAVHNPALASVLATHHVVVGATAHSAPWLPHARCQFSMLCQRVETVFSVLFDVERSGARSLKGVVCRISTRVLASALCLVTQPLLVHLHTSQTPHERIIEKSIIT